MVNKYFRSNSLRFKGIGLQILAQQLPQYPQTEDDDRLVFCDGQLNNCMRLVIVIVFCPALESIKPRDAFVYVLKLPTLLLNCLKHNEQ